MKRDLVAHAGVVGRPLRRVDAELRRRQREDQPPLACIDVLEAERVAQRGAKGLRF